MRIRDGATRGSDWMTQTTVEVGGWDGSELDAELLAMAEDEHPIIRGILARIIGVRPSLVEPQVVTALLSDPRAMVREEMWESCCLVRDPRLLPPMATFVKKLYEKEGLLTARIATVSLHEWLDAQRYANKMQPEDRALWLTCTGTYRGALTELAALGTEEASLLGARLALYQCQDVNACKEFLQNLPDGSTWWKPYLQAELHCPMTRPLLIWFYKNMRTYRNCCQLSFVVGLLWVAIGRLSVGVSSYVSIKHTAKSGGL